MKTAIQAQPVSACLTDARTYLLISPFVAGNIILPSIAHQFGMAGAVFLPIYFFVLVGTLTTGLQVGLTTALLSPLISYFMTGMPVAAMLPVVLVKGTALAVLAPLTIFKSLNLRIFRYAIPVLGPQLIGLLFEALLLADLGLAASHVWIAWPGLSIQMLTIWLLTKKQASYAD